MANPGSKGPSRSQADKERSRQQSRPVDGRSVTARPAGSNGSSNRPPRSKGSPNAGSRQQPATATKGAAGRGGPPGRRPPRAGGPSRPAASRRSPAALLTWGTVALVLIIVVVLVIVKVTGSSNNVSGPAWSPASPATVSQVANIPGSVYDTVGVRSSVAVTPPLTVKNQPPLVFPGTSLPGVYYYGAEYCPYCAAERWAIIAALSRFGTFKNLGNMESSSTDVYANTQTFTFSKASYTSKYITFRADEAYSNQVPPSGVGYTVLQVPSAYEKQLVNKYNSATYFGGSPSNYPAFPFLDFGNKVLQLSSNYSPGLLAGYTRDQIAAGLNNPKSPVTQAIIATANYIAAATCMADGNKPGSVCTSKGVTEAAKKITAGTAG